MRRYLNDWTTRFVLLMLAGVVAGTALYGDRWPWLAAALLALVAAALVVAVLRVHRGTGAR